MNDDGWNKTFSNQQSYMEQLGDDVFYADNAFQSLDCICISRVLHFSAPG